MQMLNACRYYKRGSIKQDSNVNEIIIKKIRQLKTKANLSEKKYLTLYQIYA